MINIRDLHYNKSVACTQIYPGQALSPTYPYNSTPQRITC